MLKLFSKEIKCITCEKKIKKGETKKRFGVYFCSGKCIAEYERLLEKTKENIELDKCCD